MRRAQGNWTMRFAMEVTLTAAFWGIWLYFVLPLISLLLWFAGISLFAEVMFEQGGIDAFIESLRTYGLVVMLIAISMIAWTRWNRRRYGGPRNTRTKPRPDVGTQETSDISGIDPRLLATLHESRRMVIRYDDRHQLHVVAMGDSRPAAPQRTGGD